ncbi:MAG: ABC transporter permease [Alphaproteobacteria bacterium]|nr:MAG: ABC transporter permease [Alphaproteobacteria bacterium]
MTGLGAIFRRELANYFATPLAYVFIVIFLIFSGIFTFYVGGFYERGQADLQPFFTFLPWLYLFLVPAISMRLWAEERKSGTLELLMTLPVPTVAAVLGKYLAAWVFTGLALALTFPLWITVNVLGDPDNGVILAGYIAGFFMAGAYLAIGSCLSALTRNQVIAFVLTVMLAFLFTVSGMPIVLDVFSEWAPDLVVEQVASLSFLTHFNAIVRGVIDLRDVVFFFSLIALWLVANVVVVESQKEAG